MCFRNMSSTLSTYMFAFKQMCSFFTQQFIEIVLEALGRVVLLEYETVALLLGLAEP